MSQIAEGLRQSPLGPGVGGETLMEHGGGRFHCRVVQILIEHRQVFRHHQSLEGNHRGGQAGHIEHLVVLFDGFFSATAGNIQVTFEGDFIHALGGINENLFNLRQGFQRFITTGGGIRRHHAPAQYLKAFSFQLGCKRLTGRVGQIGFRIQEDHADGVERVEGKALLFGE